MAERLKRLAGKPQIGIDCEWKCTDVKQLLGEKIKGPALLQLASDSDVVVI